MKVIFKSLEECEEIGINPAFVQVHGHLMDGKTVREVEVELEGAVVIFEYEGKRARVGKTHYKRVDEFADIEELFNL